MRLYQIKKLYKEAKDNTSDLLPSNTGFDFWDEIYTGAQKAVLDREFARRYSGFFYTDFFSDESDISEGLADLKDDILSILTFNKKRYEEMYRVFLVEDEDDPITYNYDMTETTGAQHSEDSHGQRTFTKGQQSNTIGQQETTYGAQTFTKGSEDMTYGATSFTEGQQEDTAGAKQDTLGGVTNSHNVAPYNSSETIAESEDVTSSQQNSYGAQTNTKGARTDTTTQHIDTDGQRIDTEAAHSDTVGSRSDTEGQRIDTDSSYKDEHDSDEWTLTRKGNIGVQTAGDILRIHTQYWTETYKFLQLIFDDISKQLLVVEV